MIREEEVYKIGRIGRVHGVHGEVNFMFDDDVFDRVEADYLVLNIDGILVPFFMEEYRFRTDSTALVKFCDIDTQEQARELVNCDVFFPRSLTPDDGQSLSWAQIVGYHIVDHLTGNDVGTIASVDDSTANILFCLTDGRLIPASEELITDVNQKGHTITIDLPKGILDL